MKHLLLFLKLVLFEPFYVMSATGATVLAGLGSAALTAGGNLTATNVKSKKAFKHTLALMKQQNQYQYENWQKENARQDFLNKYGKSIEKAGYKASGMSPALAMEGGSTFSGNVGSIGNVSSSPFPEYSGSEFNALASLGDLPLKVQQLKNMQATQENIEADTENKSADTGLKLSQTEKTNLESADAQLRLTREMSLDDQLKQIYGSDANKGTVEAYNIFYDNKTKEQEFETVSHKCLALIAEYDWNATFSELKKAHPEYANALLRLPAEQLNQLRAGVALSRAQALTEHSKQVVNFVSADSIAIDREHIKRKIKQTEAETQDKINEMGYNAWRFNNSNEHILFEIYGHEGLKKRELTKEVYNALITPLKDGAQILRDCGIGIGSLNRGSEKPSIVPKIGFRKD